MKPSSFDELDVAGDQHRMEILDVDNSRVRAKYQVRVVIEGVRVQENFAAICFVPAGLENGHRQNVPRRTIIVQGDLCRLNQRDLSNVDGASGVVPNRDVLLCLQGCAVLLVKLDIGVDLSARRVVGENIRENALICPFRIIMYYSISSGAKAFGDGARPCPCRDMFGAPTDLLHLLYGGRYPNFDFSSNLKRTTGSMLVQACRSFGSDVLIVRFC